MVNVAICGVGVWGKNFVRNFCEVKDANLLMCCDNEEKALGWVKENFPQVKLTSNYDEVLRNSKVDAVVIATPAHTHFEIARKALEAGKHILVEKPLTLKSSQAEVLLNLAQRKKKKLMVGHLLRYHPAAIEMKKILEKKLLGQVFYIDSRRVGLGRIREVENVMWCLGIHDVYLAIYLLGMYPERVAAFGGSFLQRKKEIEEVVFLHLFFRDGIFSHIHASWLNAEKQRTTCIVCEKGVVLFDEVLSSLKICEGGILKKENLQDALFEIKKGTYKTVKVEKKEPLKEECVHFIRCIKEDKNPLTDGKEGLGVVRVLEIAQRSLKRGKIFNVRI
ncbi:Gfo/Idh/MocA family oxidoreductase [Candidatus Aerophobetes bacterium]|nr:Gfo/Idh/MocA family oxidoreductase [Candidatus Aerophobetes bacterium]